MDASKVSEKRRCRRCCCLPWYVWLITTLTTAIVCLLLAVWAHHLYRRFTPVYEEIRCKVKDPTLEPLRPDITKLDLTLNLQVECENPNPYDIIVKDSKAGKVYMGDSRTPVGFIVQMDGQKLEAEGKGTIKAKHHITVNGALFFQIVTLLWREVPIWLELELDIGVHVDFLFGSWEATIPFDKDCGMNLAGVPGLITNPDAARLGPMVCSNSFNDLDIPSASSAQNAAADLVFSSLNIAPEQVEQGKEIKDLVLKTAMGVFFSLFAVLIIISIVLIFKYARNCYEGGSGIAAATEMKKRASLEGNGDVETGTDVSVAPVATAVGRPEARHLEV
eukprot:TRINITY_DN9136_c0_g3_i1.p1 TRINITY_DN9136_c0_g3~~TRINITY_DN9136_c0_g3_i1.p1  ORF type:complete len:334 (+),score=37.87 TRINITY_DN9136_c0_g3_i1:112-1113(+)